MKKRPLLQTREIVVASMLAALLIASKEIIAMLPNVELVTFLVILYTLHFPRLTPYIIYIFVGAQCCLYGLNIWVYMYFYIWILLYFIVRRLRKFNSHLFWVAVASAFGLLFGLLCAPVYFFLGGWKMALAWFISGIPFDVIHGVSNGILMAVLYLPINRLFLRLAGCKDENTYHQKTAPQLK